MTWPEVVSSELYPGVVRRHIAVDAAVVRGRVVYTAALQDRFVDEPGGVDEQIHGYQLRLEAEPPDMTIVGVEVVPGVLPFEDCPAAVQAARGLLGLRLTAGFRKGAVGCLGSSEGCTHLLTLALAIGDQYVVSRVLFRRIERAPSLDARARLVDVCAGWRDGGQAIKLLDAGRPLPPPRIQTTEGLHMRRSDELGPSEGCS